MNRNPYGNMPDPGYVNPYAMIQSSGGPQRELATDIGNAVKKLHRTVSGPSLKEYQIGKNRLAWIYGLRQPKYPGEPLQAVYPNGAPKYLPPEAMREIEQYNLEDPAVQLAMGADSGIGMAGIVKRMGKTYPKTFLFRNMTEEQLARHENLMRNPDLPYEASATYINPAQQGYYGEGMGLIFDDPTGKAASHAWGQDVFTKPDFSGGGQKFVGADYGGQATVNRGKNTSLEDVFAEQANVGSPYNEAIIDPRQAKLAGVGLPKVAPTSAEARALYRRYKEMAQKHKVPIFIMGDRAPSSTMDTALQQNPFAGEWIAKTHKGHPVNISSEYEKYFGMP